MKKQNENGRISEDRLSRANKRKKNNTIASILVMTGCLLVLVLVTYVAGILYSWIDSKFQDNANDLAAAAEAGGQTESAAEAARTYTQEEVDALIAEAKQQAEDEEENKIVNVGKSVDGVNDIHELKTRKNGNSVIIDAHIVVDPTLNVATAHDITTKVEKALKKEFGPMTQISLHIEPDVHAE